MKVRKSYLTVLLSVIAIICLSLTQLSLAWAETPDPQEYYDANNQTVSAIDPDGYFAKLKEQAQLNPATFSAMEEVVEVAEAYASYVDGHKQEDYFASDWADISHIMDLTASYIKLTEENYATYNENDKHLLRVIADGKSIDDRYQTVQGTYDAKKQAAAKEVEDRRQALTKANATYPNGTPENTVGYYDATGLNEVNAIKAQFDTDLAAETLDKTDYNGSVKKIDNLVEKAKADMAAVRKNDVERAYDKLQDYYATENGSKPGNAAAEKQAATDAINAVAPFWNNATPDVLKEYSTQKTAFDDFFDENEIDDSGYTHKATVETEDGYVKVTAYDASGNEYNIFPGKTTLKVYNVVVTSPKRHNAEVAIGKANKNLSIAYFIDIVVYNGVEVWVGPTEEQQEQLTYHVAINLDGYYKNYVEDGGSFITKLINLPSMGSNMTTKITECADYLKNSEGSLCYWYYVDNDDGAVKSLKYSLEEGTLMFETNLLGAVAVTENEKANLLLEPLFWYACIGALILLIVLIVLIVKFAKYKVKFYSNGGTRVKSVRARKGESFVMPDNPTREGYIFAGWFEDDELTTRFVATKIKKRKGLKAYAKWAEIIAVPEEIEEPVETPVEEPAAEETPAEEPVEAAVAPVPVEEPVEEPAEPEGPTAEQLTNYYAEVRKTALGYALAQENEKAVDGMMLVRAYKKDDAVYVYAAIDPEAVGAEKAEGALAADTPAMMKVTNDEELAKAKELIDKTMTEYGLELTGREVGELREGLSKGFGYRLKFESNEDAE